MPEIVTRQQDPAAYEALVAAHIDPRMARLYAARGVQTPADLGLALPALLSPAQLARVDAATTMLADAIAAKKRILIVADYDADGATACAVGMRALATMGAAVDFIVPDRFTLGYGLTPEIVALAAERKPDIIITVDNGIASVEGVAEANRRGIAVLVTDHHLPGEVLPDAACIVNPNQPGDTFASKNLAGVGVIFYVMSALRALLRKRDYFANRPEPNLAGLLDLVALGTVADVVRLDHNNRVLVEQGLQRIRAGRMQPGLRALLQVAGRDYARAGTYDLGFVIGPRLNAAGRLDDMSIGIACLLADDDATALQLATRLDAFNRERRVIEAGMRESALATLADIDVAQRYSLALFDPGWHQGVVGILASRIKDKYHRPVIAFAADGSGHLKGSGRSITGLHLRDALDLITKRHPHMIVRFGGHAMAAGLTIAEGALNDFAAAFEQVVREWLTPAELGARIETDGAISAKELDFGFVQSLEGGVWGQGFATPTFTASMRVAEQRVVGEKHLKLKVVMDGTTFEAMRFGSPDLLPAKIDAVFRPSINEFRGNSTLQLLLDHTT
ncbi:MAG: single-stranded-DNA-specific exonuclease RecJ [Betaproteobacteria bacterium]|nr:single-stranded-DNA-specific exonuclease RecJ [Betaproteobacteria bacterium]